MSKPAIPDFNPNWRSDQASSTQGEIDSDTELEAFLRECQEKLSEDAYQPSSRRRYEYVVNGIFRDPGITSGSSVDSSPLGDGKEELPPEESLIGCDPIYVSALYKEFLNTLSHLMETHYVEAYEQLTFTRTSAAHSRTALNFTSAAGLEESKSIDLYMRKIPGSQQVNCTLREVDRDRKSASGNDIVVRNLPTAVDNDMATALQLHGYNFTKRLYVCGHVFTNNYGNPNHIEIAVLRHYLNCDPTTPVTPNCLLVELRCIGDGEIETYKHLLHEHMKILYKYVTFAPG